MRHCVAIRVFPVLVFVGGSLGCAAKEADEAVLAESPAAFPAVGENAPMMAMPGAPADPTATPECSGAACVCAEGQSPCPGALLGGEAPALLRRAARQA
jgi:hypothetical protein